MEKREDVTKELLRAVTLVLRHAWARCGRAKSYGRSSWLATSRRPSAPIIVISHMQKPQDKVEEEKLD
jgi:hypothetical protein